MNGGNGRTVLVLLTVVAIGGGLVCGRPYADDFPYTFVMVDGKVVDSVRETSKGSAEGATDTRDYNKDEVYDQAGKINSAADAVRYHALDNQLNGHRNIDSSKGSSVDKVKHLAGENFEADKSHNRKHIKSGFTNSYHKDESGNKSSYYEDSDDHGGKQVFDNRHNARNGYADKLYRTDLRNDFLRDRYDDRMGGADLRGGHNHHRTTAVDRGNARGYRDGYRSDQGQRYDAYGQEYYPGPYHYDDHYHRGSYYEPRPNFATAPHQPASITIYEDPRDYGYDGRVVRDADVLSRDGDRENYLRRYDDDDFTERARLIYRPSPLLEYRRY